MDQQNFRPSDETDTTIMAPVPAVPRIDAHAGASKSRRSAAGSHFDARGKQRADGRNRRAEKLPRTQKGPSHDGSRRHGRGPLVALAIAVALVAIVYIAGAIAFSTIFYPGTTIAGADVSCVDAGSAAAKIRSSVSRYSLTVDGSGFTWTYEPDDPDALIDADAAAREVLGTNEPLLWPVRLFESVTASPTASGSSSTIDLDNDPDFSLFSDSFDLASFEQELGASIDSFNESRSGTFDAQSSYDDAAGAFTVEKARSNEQLDRDDIIAYAEHVLAGLGEEASLDALGDEAFLPLNGTMADSDIQTACDAANKLLGADFTLMLNGSEAGSIGPDEVAQWISFDESLTPSINQDDVTAWAKQIADGFNTVGSTRTYTREDGKQVTVSGGTFGWKVDTDALTQSIVDAINNKQTGQIDVPISQKGDVYNGQGQRDWGAYVDVDVSEQHARYYDANGNLLWESGIITGNPNNGTDTPTGVYALNRKGRDVTLRGPKDPSTGEYKWESVVSYWMPFIGSSVGLHDASWQKSSSFTNPEAYKTVGSHGCVNLPPDKASELYGMIEAGTCVIVHN